MQRWQIMDGKMSLSFKQTLIEVTEDTGGFLESQGEQVTSSQQIWDSVIPICFGRCHSHSIFARYRKFMAVRNRNMQQSD